MTRYCMSGRSDAATSFCDRVIEQAFELGILVGAVVGGEDALMLALGRGRRRRRLAGCALGRLGGAAGVPPAESNAELQPARTAAR